MPEERNRIEVDRISTVLFAPDERSRETLAAEGVEGRVEVVGDVMADATMQFAPIARRRSRLLSELELTPGRYLVATVHREANTRPERLAHIVEGLNGLTEPIVFPAHPRTAAALEREGLTLHEHVLQLAPLGYLDFAALAAQARAIVTDSGRAPEGGVLVRRAVRDPQAEHGVGRHGLGRRKPARGRRSGRPRRSGRGGANAEGTPASCTETVRPHQESLTSSLHSFPDDRAYGDPHSGVHSLEDLGRRDRRRRLRRRAAGVHLRDGREARCCSSTSSRRSSTRSTAARATSRTCRARSSRRSSPTGRLAATSDYDALRGADAILIALPTPLSKQREPDLSIIVAATREIAKRLREGQLVVLESTTYPGTTREQLLPILESTGLKAGEDFNLAFSPERVDPGSPWDVKEVPKVVGGITEECSRRAAELYGSAIGTVHTVSSPEAAELTKLLENIFRSVNIALVNELAQLCDRMGIDVWEVVDAAATKPFGFMSFKPGPGLGGHCIPVDPVLPHVEGARVRLHDRVHRARREGQRGDAVLLPLADLAGAEPQEAEVDERLADPRARRRVQAGHRRRARVAGAQADRAPAQCRRERRLPRSARPLHPERSALESVPLDPALYDCVTIVTDHSSIDYAALVDQAELVVDLRNATGDKGRDSDKVWKL